MEWTTDGVPICAGAGNQTSPTIASDGARGAIITWNDFRNGNYDIFAQSVDEFGVVRWRADGIAICTAASSQSGPLIVGDGAEGAIITWMDTRSVGTDIYAQRVNVSGLVLSKVDGVAICTATNDANSPSIASDGAGGAFIAWCDFRSGVNYDVFAQRIDRSGFLGNAAPRVTAVRGVANDQGGNIRVFWDPSYLDVWPNTTIRSYTIKMGVKIAGIVGQNGSSAGSVTVAPGSVQNVSSGAINWQTAGSVAADWSSAYGAVVGTYADSGLQGVPMYYFQVIGKGSDSTSFWTSNVDSGFSVDNIPPVGIKGASIAATPHGTLLLQWNKDIVDPDLMGYQLYRSTSSGFQPNQFNRLVLTFDTTYTDSSTSVGQTYCYRIVGVDVHGNVGTPSGD